MNASQKIQLYIAKEIKRICEKNNIKYFLIAGSLLGAVRHGGFIPWDDDMDIGMEREEYEKFIIACRTDLADEFYLQTWDSEEHYAFPFGKLMLKDTVWVEDYAKNVDINHYIYVDIFPYDAVPNDPGKRKVQKCKNMLYRQLLLAANQYDSFLYKKGIKKVIFILMRAFYWAIPKKCVKMKYKKLIMDGHEKESKEYFGFGDCCSYERGLMKKEWIDNLAPIQFETEAFMAPVDWDEYLTYLYGDYMTPPPEDKRGNYHSIIKSNFEKYESM